MDVNVFHIGVPFRYIFRRPKIYFRRLTGVFRNVWQRATRGWCVSDVWEMYPWMGTVIPDMLRYLAKHSAGYPGDEQFSTPESWQDWLNSVADVLEYAAIEDIDENEYRKLYDQAMNSVGISSYDKIEIKDKYLEMEKEIAKAKQKSAEDAMNQLGKNFFNLWD